MTVAGEERDRGRGARWGSFGAGYRIETFWRICKESFSAKMNNLHYATGVYQHCMCKSSTDA
jgi:hypothetical protein